MILWVLVFVGILLFVSGIYFLVKNYKIEKCNKGYELLSYTGFGLVLLGVILLIEPIFTSLPGNFPNIAPWGITMFISIIVGNLLLKPAKKKTISFKNTFNRLLSIFNLDAFVIFNK